jgi:hypothetical protein
VPGKGGKEIMEDLINETRAVPASEAAETLGTTPLNVLLYVKRGQLKGWEVEGTWYVELDSLAVFQENAAGKKGPAPCRSACLKAGGCGSCG